MASLVGHSLAALAVYHGCKHCWPGRLPGWPWDYALPLALGMMADLDIVFYLIWGVSWGGVHRGYSHSLAVGWGLALLAALPFLPRGWRSFTVTFLALGLTSILHPLLDFAMARGPKLPLFWPLSQGTYLATVQVIPTAYFSRTWQGLGEILRNPASLKGMGLELLEFLPLWWATLAKTWPLRALALILAMAGFGLVVLLYR